MHMSSHVTRFATPPMQLDPWRSYPVESSPSLRLAVAAKVAFTYTTARHLSRAGGSTADAVSRRQDYIQTEHECPDPVLCRPDQRRGAMQAALRGGGSIITPPCV